jgi:hypothetical protein
MVENSNEHKFFTDRLNAQNVLRNYITDFAGVNGYSQLFTEEELQDSFQKKLFDSSPAGTVVRTFEDQATAAGKLTPDELSKITEAIESSVPGVLNRLAEITTEINDLFKEKKLTREIIEKLYNEALQLTESMK